MKLKQNQIDNLILNKIIKLIFKEQKASITMLQRLYRFDYPKAKAYIEELERQGYIKKVGLHYQVVAK